MTNVAPPGKALSPYVVDKLLIETPLEHFLDARHHTIVNQKSGDLYLFRYDQPSSVPWQKTLHADGYSWKYHHNEVENKHQHTSRKDYLRAKVEEGKPTVTISTVKRFTYYNNHHKRVLIYYTGNDEDMVRGPHGNSHNDRPFIRTSAQVQAAYAESQDFGTQEYLKSKRAVMEEGILGAITTPRDQQQLYYERRKKQAEFKLHGTEVENATQLCRYRI